MPAELTPDQIALEQYLTDRNEQVREWIDAEEGRGAGMLVTDPLWWADFADVRSVADMKRYELLTDVYEMYVATYGFKPDYGELKKKSDEFLHEMLTEMHEMNLQEI